MIQKFQEWWDAPVDIKVNDGYGPRFTRRGDHICWLVRTNGSLTVRGWGFIDNEGGHQRGLMQRDAIDLIAYAGFIDGYVAAIPQAAVVFQQEMRKFENELERLEGAKGA